MVDTATDAEADVLGATVDDKEHGDKMQQQPVTVQPNKNFDNGGGTNYAQMQKNPYRIFANYNYCSSCGNHIHDDHTSATCKMPGPNCNCNETRQNTKERQGVPEDPECPCEVQVYENMNPENNVSIQDTSTRKIMFYIEAKHMN